tara:strand:- start:19529 stop:20794 length:1266 start_codon:yes stop_codon:yes gene_type:complete
MSDRTKEKRIKSLSTQKLLFDPLRDEVKKVQPRCLSCDPPETVQESPDLTQSILKRVLECDPDVAAAALGQKLAIKLIGFANAVDLDHPSLVDLFGGQLVSGDFSSDCRALVGLAAYAKEHEPSVFSRIKKILSRGKTSRDIERSIDDPEKNQLHVRFVKDRATRDKIRATKRMQTINVGIIEKKGHDIWSSHDNTFANYTRNTDVWANEIAEAESELERFQKLGCKDLARGIETDIKNFKAQIRETYFGFNRIPMTHAAVILAKIHGYEIKRTSYKSAYKILVPRSYFEPLTNFCLEGLSSQNQDYSWFNYEPRSYTISELQENHDISEEMQTLIDYLENFPDIGGKPIFDHFRVLVPGIAYPAKDWSRGTYLNEKGKKISGTVEKVKTDVDMMFIRQGTYCPILLGEKDEHCYFLSYWV